MKANLHLHRFSIKKISFLEATKLFQLKTVLIMGLSILTSSLLSGQVKNKLADDSFQAWNDSYLLTMEGKTLYRSHLGWADFDGTWTLAIDIQCAEDVYERTGLQKDKDLVATLCRDFLLEERPPYNWDGWNDDLAWMGLVLARGSQMTGITAHMAAAEKECFDLAFDRGWDTVFNDGGIWEEQPNYSNNGGTTLKEPLSTHPNGHLACLIYQETGNKEYLDKAILIRDWSRSHLFNTKTGRIINGVRPDGSLNDGDPVYNYGTYIDFLVSLYQITGDEELIRDATLAADYAVTNLPNKNGIIHNSAAYLDTWAGEFARGLGHLCKERPELWKRYYPFMKKNGDTAWGNRRPDLNLTWNGWDAPTPLDVDVKVTKYVSLVDLLQHTPIIQNPMATVESDSYNYMKGVTFAEANNKKFAESIDKDDWLDYIVDVPTDGNYTISFDVAGTGTGSFGVQFNHKTLQTVQVPNTGGLENYQTVNVGMKLEKGIQSIRIFGITGGYRLDKWIAAASPVITPYVNVNLNGLENTANASGAVGNGILLSPQSTGDGTWSWTGPNGFTAADREISIANIQLNQGGKYTATYKTTAGLIATQNFLISLAGCVPTAITTEIITDTETLTSSNVTIEAGNYVRIKPMQTDGTWSWIGPDNFTANTAEISFNSIGYKQAGTYTVTYTNPNGCKSSKTIEIALTGKDPCGTTIVPSININNGSWKKTSNANIAIGSSIKFGPQPITGGSWSWTGPNGFSANTREFLITNFSAANQGIYTATYLNAQGCKSTLDFAISLEGCVAGVSAVAEIKVNGADWLNGDNVIVPSGQSLSITFPNLNGGSLSWVRPRGTTEYSAGFVVEKATSYVEGNYVFNVIDSNGCPSTRTINVQVSGNDFCATAIEPYLNLNGKGMTATSTTIFNIGDNLEFGPRVGGATSGFRWTWSFNGTELQSGKDSRVLVLNNMTKANAGVYTLITVNSNGCRSYIDFNINYSNCDPTSVTPHLKINNNDWKENSSAMLVGIGENVSFSPQPTTGGNWIWTGPNGYTSTSREISFSNIQANQLGGYKATFTNGCGTASSLDFIIGNRLEAENAIITSGIIEPGATGKFVNLEGGGKLVWGVAASESASHVIEFNLGVPNTSTRIMGVFVNGVKAGVITSSLIGYETHKITANLNKGNNTIELRDSENTSEFNVDYIKLSITPTLGLDDNTVSSKNDFSMYPNPNNGILNIDLNGEKYNSLNIYTINGMLVYSKELNGEDSLKLNLSSYLRTGVYIVSLKSNSTISTKKLIVR